MPNVIDLLKQDRRTVEELFAQFETSPDADWAETICAEIEEHANAEERAVYPALREGVVGGAEMADHAEKEHAEARQLIGRIRQTQGPEHLAELVSELKHAIEEHVAEEEGEVFPKMQAEMGSARLEELGAQVEALKS
jgi:iron-sulfur cluster repair protein YtfE (RIC family)